MTDTGVNILLIEDNPGDAELIASMLGNLEQKYRVAVSQRLSTGLKMLETESFDAVLLDLGLPDSSGIDTLRKIQGQGFNLPVIVLTGLADEEIALESISAGAQDYLIKGQIESHLLVCSVRYAIERKRTEEALRESEARFRSMASTALDAVILIDNNGKVSFWNEAATKIFGYTKDEVIGTYLHDAVMPPCHMDSFMKGFRNFRSTGEGPFVGKVYETEAKRKDGTEFPVELSLSALRLEGKWNAVGVVRDITGRKKAEGEVKRLNDALKAKIAELEHSVKELDAFSYSVSHDLRAPLRIIGAYSDILLDESQKKLDENEQKLLGTIKKNARKMEELIEGLLYLSKVGRKEIRHSDLNIAKMAQEVFEELSADSSDRRIELFVKEMPLSRGDRVLIRQVLVNVIANSIKFTKGKDPSVIEISGRSEDEFNIYTVSDNGIGFDMKHSEKIFDVFHTLHHPREFEGTGIGLSIVRRIVERHGGRICAEGKPNQGAIMHFTLPKN